MVLLKNLLVCTVITLGITVASAYVNPHHTSRHVPSIGTQNTHNTHPQHDISTSKSPAAAFRGNPPIQHQLVDKQNDQQYQQKHQTKPASYSLGLGKNLPVGSRKNDLRAHTVILSDVHEAVQFWNEHENVNEYPSPLLVARARETALIEQQELKQLQAITVGEEKRKSAISKPRIVPKRFFGDSLPIFLEPAQQQQPHNKDQLAQNDKATASKSVPIMRSRKPAVDRYDLNTPWVEMLIHEQQMKFQAAS